ncbi:hypothetical protein [Buchnera aphidicola]|uniref:CCA-adding enzyme n=1 Tax=Buchnera aphidicola subsp. Tuberolachnus salignus TaxID=98804 RepID=A0A170PBH0_BUCTT|nr:hypothetical protein [Buchnera aphidicola]CUR53023.1 Multifunctional CCA protein [Buchnera aphidicola (Tuberolachnus salignus)]
MKIYLVGGAIRDSLLGLPIHDRDWVVVGSTPEKMIKKNFLQVGKDFPVFIHPLTREEYALARTERKNGVGYTGFKINFSKKVTLEEDLVRRDLTINAIAQDQVGNFIDPFFGRLDIKKRVLRHVSKAFQEDPLRVFRVARFSANLFHLGFFIAKETLSLMKLICKTRNINTLLPDRIWKEMEKGLKSFYPHVFLMVLDQCKALKYVCPEIFHLLHPVTLVSFPSIDMSLRQFIFKELARISYCTKNINIRFSYLCQFFSKICPKSISSKKFIFFDKKSSEIVNSLCLRLKVSTEIRKISVFMCGFYYFLQNIFVQKSEDIVKFFNIIDLWRKPKRLKHLKYLKNYEKSFFSRKCKMSLGELLLAMFNVVQQITVKTYHLKKNFTGIEIRLELNRLRSKVLKKWLHLNFFE